FERHADKHIQADIDENIGEIGELVEQDRQTWQMLLGQYQISKGRERHPGIQRHRQQDVKYPLRTFGWAIGNQAHRVNQRQSKKSREPTQLKWNQRIVGINRRQVLPITVKG